VHVNKTDLLNVTRAHKS